MSRLLKSSKALERRLLAIPDEVLAQVRPSLVKGAQDIANTAELLVPEDEGDLQNTIAITGPGETTPAYAVGGSSVTLKRNQAAVTAGSAEVRTGHMQEFGTVHHPAQPFMRPAFRINKAKVMRRFQTAVNKAVKAAGVTR